MWHIYCSSVMLYINNTALPLKTYGDTAKVYKHILLWYYTWLKKKKTN